MFLMSMSNSWAVITEQVVDTFWEKSVRQPSQIIGVKYFCSNEKKNYRRNKMYSNRRERILVENEMMKSLIGCFFVKIEKFGRQTE